jgi:hypothetical protein
VIIGTFLMLAFGMLIISKAVIPGQEFNSNAGQGMKNGTQKSKERHHFTLAEYRASKKNGHLIYLIS